MMSTPEGKLRASVSSDFEQAYLASVQEKYDLSGLPATYKSMGSPLSRMNKAKSQENSTQQIPQEPINGRLPQLLIPGSINNCSRRNVEDQQLPKQSSPRQNARKRKRRVSSDDSDDEVTFNLKRKRIDDISKRLRGSETPSYSAKAAALTLKTAIGAKRGNKSDFDIKKESGSEESYGLSADKRKSLETVKNLKGHNLSEIYTNVLKDNAGDTSPFKGKMSAFEISLLKGKQSVERRKSLEAAALRSSPRMNSNVPKPVHKNNRKRRRINSLPETGVERLRTQRKTVAGQLKALRVRTSRCGKDEKSLPAVSPSSIENRFVEQDSPVRRRRRATLTNSSVPDTKADSPRSVDGRRSRDQSRSRKPASNTIAYRMNGSPKLRPVPPVLSLTSLSGMPQKLQGSSSSSLYAGFRANGLSGIPPALPSPTSALDMDLCGMAARPHSLPMDHSTIPEADRISLTDHSPMDTTVSRQEAAMSVTSGRGDVCRSRSRQLTLEETVNLLRKSTTGPCSRRRGEAGNAVRLCVSPSLSEGRLSRRSSRSSTPNISPMKTEVLTPSNTPCSTPNKSPRSSPSVVGGRMQKTGKRKGNLFAKHDDVLARWHDGLFYSGTILRIDEKNNKCLLRYEDNSEFWSMFKDIHRVAREEEMICCVCLGGLSEPPDEIVLCDNCSQGYHQKCHTPSISSRQIVDPDDEWFCRECVFLMSAKVGGAIKDGKAGEELRKMKTSLPYELDTLTWDMQHKNNVEQCYCYCGGPGIWYQKMLQCCRCKQWYHEACMQCTEFPLMFGDSFYIFVCTSCNYGNEYIKRVDIEWQDLMHIALFNLVMENKKKKYFHVNRDIIPWLDLNLQALQIPKYENLNPEEKFQMTMEAFQSYNTRFSCAGENFKKTLQWGLRIRVPPPRIFITLPVTCKVSDDVMKKLKIKGRRSKVFIPMECLELGQTPSYLASDHAPSCLHSKSPVLQIRHSPLHINSSARKKLNDSLSIKVVGSNSPVKSQVASITRRKSNVKLPLLERLIPREPVFTDHLHPFKTEQELEQAQEEMNQRAEIWVSYQTMSASNSFDTVDTNQDLNADGPPILEKVEPISPSTSNSSTPPMPEINKKKGSRKSVQSEKDSKDSMLASRRKSRRVSLKVSSPPNILDSQVSVKKVKTSGQNYFCAFDKTGYGKGFFIRGACARDNGEMQYLVDWDV